MGSAWACSPPPWSPACGTASGLALPARGEALHRLEADSGLTHRPLTHLTDRQASNLVDPWATVLWAHHQKRLLANLGELNLAPPRSDVARRDPIALRGLAILLLALGVGVAWEQSGSRLMASVAPQPRGSARPLQPSRSRPGSPRRTTPAWRRSR